MKNNDSAFFKVYSVKKLIELVESMMPLFEKVAEKEGVPEDSAFLLAFGEEYNKEREEIEKTWGESDSWKKFRQNKEEIFRHEVFFPVFYKNPGGKYHFSAPSKSLVNFFWIIYQALGGKDDYSSPSELLTKFKEVIHGKRILEIGPGPGFTLKVLADAGALVKGIEIRSFDFLPEANIVLGNACSLEKHFEENVFDLIISHDFFCEAVVSQEESLDVLSGSAKLLKKGGLMVNQVNFFRVDSIFNYAIQYFEMKKQGLVKDANEFIERFDSYESFEKPRWSNKISLRIDHFFPAGFSVRKIWAENSYINIILERS